MSRTPVPTPTRKRRTLARTLVGAVAATALLGTLSGCTKEVFELEVGQCLNSADIGDTSEVKDPKVIDCSKPHDLEVYHIHTYEDTKDFPGQQAIQDQGSQACAQAFEPFVGKSYEESEFEVFMLFPSEDSWTHGNDRTTYCLLQSVELVTESLKGAAR